jgi:dTMP kinase
MPAHAHNGHLIVFEGIDGAGTTTQVERYAAYLRERRRLVHVTREPSDGPVGVLLRLALAGRTQFAGRYQPQLMGQLFAADRLDHLANEIEPHLRDGTVVLCDRYDLSTIAYQSATARGDDDARDGELEAWLRELNRFAVRPDATVVINVSPDEAERRRRMRGAPPELFEDTRLQERLAALYADAASLLPGDEMLMIDGDGSTDEVELAVRKALAPIVNPS